MQRGRARRQVSRASRNSRPAAGHASLAGATQTVDKEVDDHDAQPRREIPPVSASPPEWPPLADPHDRARADLDEHRPARRQPVADRADEHRGEARILRDAGGDGFQGNRSGLSVGIADGFRLRAQADRRKAHSRRRHHRSARAVAPRTDRAHVRGGRRRDEGDRASLQRDRALVPAHRVQPVEGRGEGAGRRRHAHHQGMRGRAARTRTGPTSIRRRRSA